MIFVFGSNLAGRHGAGAAKFAHVNYGAEYGVGSGRTGDSYAIPTKDFYLKTMTLERIYPHICDFTEYARQNQKLHFLLTPIGTGLAGHKMSHIRLLFKQAGLPSNVYLSSTWITDDNGM